MCALLLKQYIPLANDMHSENSEELNGIRHSPYISDCQSLHAKFDYIKLLIDKFVHNKCHLQVICLPGTWISSETDLSPYIIPGYHLISTPHYASSHGGLVIYLSEKWDYTIKTDDTLSKLWERQIIKISDPNKKLKRKVVIGNMYRLPHNSRDNLTNVLSEFSATLIEYNTRGHNPGACPGGGAKGPAPPPPRNWKSKKKRSSEQIWTYFTYIFC